MRYGLEERGVVRLQDCRVGIQESPSTYDTVEK